MIKNIDESNFKQETSNGIVLVEVFTPSCGPCMQQINILEKCIGEFKIVKINAHKCVDFILELQVKTVPTLIWYKNGIEAKRTTGIQRDVEILNVFKELNKSE